MCIFNKLPFTDNFRMASALIVEDNRHVRSALRTFVEKNTPLKVCGEAADGLEAIEKTKELMPDVILLDVAMPKLSGVEAAPILRSVVPNAHIIMVTMFADYVGPRLASAVGIYAVHAKVDGMEKLADILKRAAAAYSEQNDPEHITPLCMEVAGEQDGKRLRRVIDELHREELPDQTEQNSD